MKSYNHLYEQIYSFDNLVSAANVDDFAVLADDKSPLPPFYKGGKWLHEVKDQMAAHLAQLRLKLHPRKCVVFPTKDGTDFLGYRIFPTHRLLRKSNITRTKRRLKRLQVAYSRGEIPLEKVRASIHSWIAHASWADTYHLRRKLLGNTAFVRVSQPSNRL